MGQHRAAIMFIDLDRFQDINDTLGHNVGDQLLKNVALRFNGVLETQYTLARQGGDEFIVLLPNIADEQAALAIGQTLLATLRQPFNEMAHEFLIGASIGLSLYPDHGLEGSILLRNADTAMYEAKAAGGNTVRLYNSPMNQRIQSRVCHRTAPTPSAERGSLRFTTNRRQR